MKIKILIYCTAFLFLFACSHDDEPGANCAAPGPPAFEVEPNLFNNINSVELRFKTNIPANIYYVVSETELTNKSADTIKMRAESGENILKSGSFQVSCNDLDTTTSIRIADLPEEKTLYAYMVAESFAADTRLQEQATEFVFTTSAGLATHSFYSQVKGRDALYVRHIPLSNPDYAHQLHPLLIFLGGNSEVSPAGEITVVKNGSPLLYVSRGNQLPFYVIGPEHNTNYWHVDFLHEVIAHAIKNFPIDPDRVIITGLSGGANGTLNYAMKYPEVPAAIVPIGGWASEPGYVCNLTDMAVWLIHNENDHKVGTNSSIRLYDALIECSPPPTKEVRLTLFKDPGHNAWHRVYDPNHSDWDKDTTIAPFNVYDWMYEQRR